MKNIALMKQIREQITEDPHSLNMDVWVNYCGTSACMAGHAGIIAKEVIHYRNSGVIVPATSESWTELGARLLGVDEETADFWFHETDYQGALEILDAFIAGEEIDILRVVQETNARQWLEFSEDLDYDA
jgi:hypothetical protein